MTDKTVEYFDDGDRCEVVLGPGDRYPFAIYGDPADIETYSYTREGEAPDEVLDALQEWINEHLAEIVEIERGAVTYAWRLVDRDQDDVVDGYRYAGDGDPSDAAVEALQERIDDAVDD